MNLFRRRTFVDQCLKERHFLHISNVCVWSGHRQQGIMGNVVSEVQSLQNPPDPSITRTQTDL